VHPLLATIAEGFGPEQALKRVREINGLIQCYPDDFFCRTLMAEVWQKWRTVWQRDMQFYDVRIPNDFGIILVRWSMASDFN